MINTVLEQNNCFFQGDNSGHQLKEKYFHQLNHILIFSNDSIDRLIFFTKYITQFFFCIIRVEEQMKFGLLNYRDRPCKLLALSSVVNELHITALYKYFMTMLTCIHAEKNIKFSLPLFIMARMVINAEAYPDTFTDDIPMITLFCQ